MARKQSGGLNKFLNFIGLVDDAEPAYENEYASENYGRPSTYIPQRQRAANARAAQPSGARNAQSASRRSLPAPGRTSQRAYGEDDYRPSRRAAYEDDYADAPQAGSTVRSTARTDRARSRFEEEPPRRAEAPAPLAAPQRTRVSRPQRTVMRSLHGLEDCCDVIDNLIRGNTIVLTMDELDGHLMQRAVDTLSGAVFALHATIRKASDKTYLIVPSGVEVEETYDVDRRF